MNEEERESIYLLQKIDCNCNNCAFMDRDFETYDRLGNARVFCTPKGY